MSQREWPRDPSRMGLTRHAKDMMKDRNIGLHEIKKCIREGKINVEGGAGDHEALYRLEIPGVDLLVLVDKSSQSVETVYWDDEQGADEGSLGGRYGMLGNIL